MNAKMKPDAVIILRSNDDELFPVSYNIIKSSATIRVMLETLSDTVEDEDPIDLPNVNAQTLRFIIEWATHHGNFHGSELTDWDLAFLNRISPSMLQPVLEASNYLEISSLRGVICKHIASWIKGKTTGEMKEILNITSN